jgi:hypothetical protein
MRRVPIAACALLLSLPVTNAFARGVSPYLPLSTDPEMEARIEYLLILADRPVLRRPIAAATVLDAMPDACRKDPVLCEEVRRYLAPYMREWGVSDVTLEAAVSSDEVRDVPNRFGLTTDSQWVASARGHWQPFDHALLSLGAVAYQDEIVPEGSYFSFGWDRAQLDIGYRAHWLSPAVGSSMLLSTNAATMPSVTLSNYTPLTRFGFSYEIFGALMSRSDRIIYRNAETSGRPRLAGLHVSMEPASGWALGASRVMQYGGGERPGSLGDLFKAFFSPSKYDNTSAELTVDEQVGNQAASITSELIFPGPTPFSVYFEYSGEDTSNAKNYLLGNAALTAGIRFPRLGRRFDLVYEASEWQNQWYLHHVYLDGLIQEGRVIGHWGGDERIRGDQVGAQSHLLRIGWNPPFGGRAEAQLRTIENESYGVVPYERGYDGTLRYSYPLMGLRVGAEVFAGRDVFGENFSRIGAFVRYTGERDTGPAAAYSSTLSPSTDKSAELFVEAGAAYNRVSIDLDARDRTTETNASPHFAVGARRAVSDYSDLGARIELDDVDGHTLLSVRAIDYRFRYAIPLALNVFVGASRYDVATPAYGLYFGAGLQWRDILPGWDIGFDVRTAKKVARDHVLPDDADSTLRPDSFYTVQSLSMSVSRRF